MPRYRYRCKDCENEFLVMHPSDEILEECKMCNHSGSLLKLVSRPSYPAKNTKNTKKTGALTKEFIEESRQDLKQQKQDLNKQR